MDAYETTIYTAVLITGVLLGLVIVFFGWAMVRSQRRYFDKRRQQFLSQMEVVEEERVRIARDLHDELGPVLSMTRLQLQRVATQLPEREDSLERIEQRLGTIVQRMRGIARNLKPYLPEEDGLRIAVTEFIGEWRGASGLTVFFSYDVKSPLGADLSLHVFRMVQEVVHNAIRHAGAQTLDVRIREQRRRLHLICRDDGGGFDTLQAPGKGIGLTSLRERAVLLGGRLQLESGAGGTIYFFDLPIK